MSTAQSQLPAEQRFVLSSIDWPTYLVFSDKLGERNVRVTYDRGEMELMTLSPHRERAKHLLGLLLAVLVEELDIDIAGYGSMTFRREDLENGLEPDECYWIAHEAQVRGKEAIDLTIDPPPDLFLEIEITRSFLDRLAICARLWVPEVWRWDGQRLRVCILGPDGQYTESDRSLAFPFLPMPELARFLSLGGTMSETKLLQTFRKWVREQIARGWKA
jgi:Uma2 family endonuclease